MLPKSRYTAVIFLLVAFMLVFSLPLAVVAQDTTAEPLDEASDLPATTEIVSDVSFTVENGELIVASAPVGDKISVQEYAKSIPPANDLNTPMDKYQLYIPYVSQGEATIGAATADAAWIKLLQEGFEGTWPWGAWAAFDQDGGTNGALCWDDDDYMPYKGAWSAWAAGGCADGLDPQYYYYRDNMRSWMVYGPFSLANAKKGKFTFRYWNRSEACCDFFSYGVSRDGATFYGKRYSGDSRGWHNIVVDLAKVPTLGNALGDSTVWVAFTFTSDNSIVLDGPFVDEVTVQRR